MTPDEHREAAADLLDFVSTLGEDLGHRAAIVAEAQVHATLALTPPPPAQPPQQRVDTSRPVHVYDITGDYFEVAKASGGGVVINHDGAGFGTVIEDPATIRLFANALTAHADRMESRP